MIYKYYVRTFARLKSKVELFNQTTTKLIQYDWTF